MARRPNAGQSHGLPRIPGLPTAPRTWRRKRNGPVAQGPNLVWAHKKGAKSLSRFLLERLRRIEINQFSTVRVGVGSQQVGRLHISARYAVLVEMIQCACCSTKRDSETTVVHAAPTQGRPP